MRFFQFLFISLALLGEGVAFAHDDLGPPSNSCASKVSGSTWLPRHKNPTRCTNIAREVAPVVELHNDDNCARRLLLRTSDGRTKTVDVKAGAFTPTALQMPPAVIYGKTVHMPVTTISVYTTGGQWLDTMKLSSTTAVTKNCKAHYSFNITKGGLRFGHWSYPLITK